jgi:hypothetical protein
MKKVNSKNCFVLVFAVLLAFSIVQLPTVAAKENSVSDQVLTFLENVAKFNLTKYNVTLVNVFDMGIGGITRTSGVYRLESDTSRIDVSFTLTNGTLSSCIAYPREGVIKYNHPIAVDLNSAAVLFLESYQEWLNDATGIEAMKKIASMVDVTKATTVIYDGMKLEIKPQTANKESTTFNWRVIINGAEYNGLSVSFKDGAFNAFKDDRSYYHIGDTTVAVSKETAIDVALKQIQNFSYVYVNETICNFSIREDAITALLLTMDRYEPFVLYPYWQVNLPLTDMYPGYVNSIVVKVWANNAEVIECKVMGFDALITENVTRPPLLTEISPSTSPSIINPQNTLLPSPDSVNAGNRNLGLLTGIILTIATILIATVIIATTKKKLT